MQKKLEIWGQFYQHFMSSFCTSRCTLLFLPYGISLSGKLTIKLKFANSIESIQPNFF